MIPTLPCNKAATLLVAPITCEMIPTEVSALPVRLTNMPVRYGPPDVVLRSCSSVSAAVTLPSRSNRSEGVVPDDVSMVRRFAVESYRSDGDPRIVVVLLKKPTC